jgi:hypothetical protein
LRKQLMGWWSPFVLSRGSIAGIPPADRQVADLPMNLPLYLHLYLPTSTYGILRNSLNSTRLATPPPIYLHLPTYIYIWNVQDPQVPSFSFTKIFSCKRPYEAYWARKEELTSAFSFLPVWLSPAGQSPRPTPIWHLRTVQTYASYRERRSSKSHYFVIPRVGQRIPLCIVYILLGLLSLRAHNFDFDLQPTRIVSRC